MSICKVLTVNQAHALGAYITGDENERVVGFRTNCGSPKRWATQAHGQAASSGRRIEAHHLIFSADASEADRSDPASVDRYLTAVWGVVEERFPNAEKVAVVHDDGKSGHVHVHVAMANHDGATGKAFGVKWTHLRKVHDEVMAEHGYSTPQYAPEELEWSTRRDAVLKQKNGEFFAHMGDQINAALLDNRSVDMASFEAQLNARGVSLVENVGEDGEVVGMTYSMHDEISEKKRLRRSKAGRLCGMFQAENVAAQLEINAIENAIAQKENDVKGDDYGEINPVGRTAGQDTAAGPGGRSRRGERLDAGDAAGERGDAAGGSGGASAGEYAGLAAALAAAHRRARDDEDEAEQVGAEALARGGGGAPGEYAAGEGSGSSSGAGSVESRSAVAAVGESGEAAGGDGAGYSSGHDAGSVHGDDGGRAGDRAAQVTAAQQSTADRRVRERMRRTLNEAAEREKRQEQDQPQGGDSDSDLDYQR